VKKKMKDGKTYLTDSVPFSCCDPRVRRPCVHHSMLSSFQHTKYDSSNVTVYEVGCRRAMSDHYAQTVSSFLKLLVACLVLELTLTVTFRHSEILLRGGSQGEREEGTPPPPVRNLTPHLSQNDFFGECITGHLR